ncbi:hypothetical protein PG994_008451 [Apiospora phragmitis]|uniref:Uncharacterized protein n=1 Tax=Apiospora phragmitis TaxID=2905665 RepID=A0ABR1UGH5_9PEZI
MAVLDAVPGIQVSLRVKGKIATEYPNPDPQQRYDFSYKDHALDFHTHVDGPMMDRYCICGEDAKYEGRRFAEGEVVEDNDRDRVEKDKMKAEGLGVIEVQIFRVILRGKTSYRDGPIKNKPTAGK